MPNKHVTEAQPFPAGSDKRASVVWAYDPATDDDYRLTAGELADIGNGNNGTLPGPNLRPDLRKAVRWASTAVPGYDADGPVLTGLDPNTCCLATTVDVEFDAGAYGTVYKFVFEEPDGPWLIWRDATFTGPQVHAKLVRIDSPEAQTGSVLTYSPALTLVKQGVNVLHTIGERGARFEAAVDLVHTAFPGNVIPAPTGTSADAGRWIEQPIGSQASPRATIGQPAFRQLYLAGQLQPDKVYFVSRYTITGGGETGQPVGIDPLPPVLCYATSPGSIWPLAELDPDGAKKLGSYDVASDTFAEQDFSLVSSVRVSYPGLPSRGFASLQAAAETYLAELGSLEDCSFVVNDTQTITADVDLHEAAAIIGQQVALTVTDGATLILPKRSFGLLLGGGTTDLRGTINTCRVVGGGVRVTTGAAVYDSVLAPFGHLSGTLRIGPGCQLASNFFSGYTDNGDGTYTTPQGGTVSDERGGGGPASPVRDIYAVADVNLDLRAALTADGHTWAKGDLTAYASPEQQLACAPPAEAGQPAGVLIGTADVQAGDTFDAEDYDGDAFRYTYCRRNDGTLGWTRLPKPV